MKIGYVSGTWHNPGPKAYEISYAGTREITVRGKKVTAHEFLYKRGSSQPISLFVNEERALNQCGAEMEGEFAGFELVGEKTAKEYLKKIEDP